MPFVMFMHGAPKEDCVMVWFLDTLEINKYPFALISELYPQCEGQSVANRCIHTKALSLQCRVANQS